MTIKLGACFDVVADETVAGICIAPSGADGGMPAMAWCDTPEERDTVLRALENVLAPRFTRDEAIAIIREAISGGRYPRDSNRDLVQGARLALEALAAAGAFVDGDVTIRDQSGNGNDLSAPTMAAKLDAAGIR